MAAAGGLFDEGNRPRSFEIVMKRMLEEFVPLQFSVARFVGSRSSARFFVSRRPDERMFDPGDVILSRAV